MPSWSETDWIPTIYRGPRLVQGTGPSGTKETFLSGEQSRQWQRQKWTKEENKQVFFIYFLADLVL